MNDDPNLHYAGGLGVSTYDLFAARSPFSGDIAFYRDCAAHFGGPVLELGCGTARVTLELARAGHACTGLDLSEAMLDAARAKLAQHPGEEERIRLFCADMADFDLDERFALIIVPARSFQHVVTAEGQRAALACMHRHLRPGGHLVLDLFDPNFKLLFDDDTFPPPPREGNDPSSGRLIRRTVLARDCDPFHQTVRETLRFDVMDHDGNRLASEETGWTLRWSLRQEMAYLLELSGFEPIALYSDFEKSPPAYGREQLWIARAV